MTSLARLWTDQEFMAKPDTTTASPTPPWETPRLPAGRNFVRRSLPWLGVLGLVALIIWGLWPKPVLIETGTAVVGPLTVRVSEEGKTRVKNRFIIAAPVAGKMRRVSLKPGDEVMAGDTLVTTIEPTASPLLDPRARTQAEAAVEMREASRRQAAEALEARRAALKLADTDRDRMRAMTRSGSMAESDRDQMEADSAMKGAEFRAAEFFLQVTDYELAQARATLAPTASATPGELVPVKSPVSGRVLKVMQESEMVVTPGTQILEIGDPTDIEIEAEILSRDAVAIQPGDAVEVDQWGGETPLKGRVRRVEPAAFTKISALGVEEQRVIVLTDLVDIPAAAKSLGDRYRVEVRVAVWQAEKALIVPAGALFREGNTWKTYVFRDATARLTTVDAGHSDGRFTEIRSGLRAGDEVLLHPPDTVKDGMAVTKRTE